MEEGWSKEGFWAELEERGEDKVHEHLAVGAYHSPKKIALAKEWLRSKAQERVDRSNSEQMRITRSAKNAAWMAAIAAIIAAIAAIISIWLSLSS